jgi:hypothetical protein
MRPLLVPWFAAAVGGLVPPVDELVSVFSTFLSFGGFAVLAATVYAVEFQERTLPLLFSQPAERSRLWRDKLSAIAVAAIALAALNWRVHQFLADWSSVGSLFGWLFLLFVISSSGFWILTTRSVLAGVALSFAVQLLVFIGLGVAAAEIGSGVPVQEYELITSVTMGGLIYCVAFLWLGREFWKTESVKKVGVALLVPLLFGLGQLLAGQGVDARVDVLDTRIAGLFVLATVGSVGWWTLAARTTIGGAVLTVACQFLSLLVVKVVISQLSGTDVWLEDTRFAAFVFLGTPLYSAVFLWAGWKKFCRLEVKDVFYEESPRIPAFGGIEHAWSRFLRCRAGEGILNLARKELRLQKPLLMLATVFCACYLATHLLHWLQPHRGYAAIGDVLVCLYAPLCLVLAGSLSLSEEKLLGVASWHLALPISVRRQWLIKIVVGALAGIMLGLVLPLMLAWISSQTGAGGFIFHENDNGWLALAGVSVGLFVLSFWAATLVTNTIRAALTAIVSLVPLFFCGMAGKWCAEQICGFAHGFWIQLGMDGQPEVPGIIGVFGFVAISVAIALVESLLQFRRVRIPAFTVVTHSLVLGFGVVLGSFWWTAVMLSAAK